MIVAGWIMSGDPQLPDNFIDWGQQDDEAYIMPSYQCSGDTEHERCFGIQRDEPCGCRKLSLRWSIPLKVDTKTREILKWGYHWKVETIETCKEHGSPEDQS